MDDFEKFAEQNRKKINDMANDNELKDLTSQWYLQARKHEYTYHFEWMGLPIIQYPQDMVAMQELIFKVKPDLIIETGIARGGSMAFYASMLELLGNNGKVVGVDIDIRAHNRKVLEEHPMYKNMILIEGSSTDLKIYDQVKDIARNFKTILVALDSMHTEGHVLQELALYSQFVKKDSYLVVFDTMVERTPKSFFTDRPWGPGNNPMTAVKKFLEGNTRFKIDKKIESKLQLTECPNGYLICVEDI